uniref:Uncharacterized protein n=1 Tax=Leersia perrieri TaxID=77586 RepID=A0A0D9VDA5_9ORYZ
MGMEQPVHRVHPAQPPVRRDDVRLDAAVGPEPVADQLVVARVVGQHVRLGHLPEPRGGGVGAVDEGAAPPRPRRGARPRELDGEGGERAGVREEEDGAGAVERSVGALADAVDVGEEHVVVVEDEEAALGHGLLHGHRLHDPRLEQLLRQG